MISLLQLAREKQHEYDADIVLAQKGDKLMELHKEVEDETNINWITTRTSCGQSLSSSSWPRSSTST